MAMHRQHPDPQFDLSTFSAPVTPAATLDHPPMIDTTVSEWTADLSTGPHPATTTVPTQVAHFGYVDFDVIDSMHETIGSAVAVTP